MQLAQASTLPQTRDALALEVCTLARQLENIGDYEGARRALSGFWTVIGERPDIDNLSRDAQAEMLWRVGTLSGWIGSARQVNGAQAFAKDLIAESVRLFEDIGSVDRTASAETDLALCYWREGAMEEARVFYEQALSHATTSPTRVRVCINYAIVEYQCNRHPEALSLLDQAAPTLDGLDDMMRGRYHTQRAIVLRRIGGPENLDLALIENTAASYHFEKAGHTAYHALAENNIGNLLLEFHRYDEAHEHLNRASEAFSRVRDLTKAAQTNETRARAFIAQANYAAAIDVALAAVTALKKGDEPAVLAEALITHGIALARFRQPAAAMESFVRAASVAKLAGDNTSVVRARLTSIEELHEALPPQDLISLYLDAENTLTGTVPAATLAQLRNCAKLTVDAVNGLANPALAKDLVFKGKLADEILRYEANLIRHALERAGGSITKAAELLGMKHQSLSEMLDVGRHKTLRQNPIKRRTKRSLTRKR